MHSDVVIVSRYFDLHAAAVEWALKQKGASAQTWSMLDMPQAQRISLHFGDGLVHPPSVTGTDLDISSIPSATWIRRVGLPVLSDTIDQRDRKFAGAQCRIVTEAALRSLSDQSFSVNPLDAGSRCHSKPYQLAIASRIGLRTPETIVTNCSAQLESFYAAHDGKIVHKPLQFSSWIGADGRRFVASTVKVTPLLLEHRSLIEHSPGIFQRLIDKAFEVRVHVIGSVVYAAKLFTKESSSSIDWRFDFSGSPPLCAFELPVSVKEKCLHFMAEAGLRFGCFDFIVDEQENYYFLEVNEMGQFLWVEINDPALPLLDAFSSFLLSGDDNFMHHRHGMNVRYSDFQAHYRANRTGYEQLSKRHVPAPIEQVIFEDAAITQAMLERGES